MQKPSSSPTKNSWVRPIDGDLYTKYFSSSYDFLVGLSGWRSKITASACQGVTPGKMLDVGCGTGYLMHLAQQQGFTVTGIDASAGMLDQAREKFNFNEQQLIHTGAEKLPFADESFDFVVACGSLCYVSAMSQAAKELSRVLKPSGLLRIIDHMAPKDKNGFTPLMYVFSQISGDLLHDHEVYFQGLCQLRERQTLGRGGYLQRMDFTKLVRP